MSVSRSESDVSGGKKQNRYSFLEHKWTFQVAPSAGFMINLNAWSSGSSDGDSFVFAWSTNDSDYTDFLTINIHRPGNDPGSGIAKHLKWNSVYSGA